MSTKKQQMTRQFETEAEELRADRREKDRRLTIERRQARFQKSALQAA